MTANVQVQTDPGHLVITTGQAPSGYVEVAIEHVLRDGAEATIHVDPDDVDVLVVLLRQAAERGTAARRRQRQARGQA